MTFFNPIIHHATFIRTHTIVSIVTHKIIHAYKQVLGVVGRKSLLIGIDSGMVL